MKTTKAVPGRRTGSFVPMPSAFLAAPEGVQRGLKFRVQVEHENHPDGDVLQEYIVTDQFLVDLGDIDAAAIDIKRAIADCDIVRRQLEQNPEQLLGVIRALQVGDLGRASKIARDIGFTEEDSIEQGGGALFLIFVVLAALGAGGCATCNAKRPGSKPKAGPEP